MDKNSPCQLCLENIHNIKFRSLSHKHTFLCRSCEWIFQWAMLVEMFLSIRTVKNSSLYHKGNHTNPKLFQWGTEMQSSHLLRCNQMRITIWWNISQFYNVRMGWITMSFWQRHNELIGVATLWHHKYRLLFWYAIFKKGP